MMIRTQTKDICFYVWATARRRHYGHLFDVLPGMQEEAALAVERLLIHPVSIE